MASWGYNLSLGWICVGTVCGLAATYATIFLIGRKVAGGRLKDRGPWEQPLPHSFPPDQVVAKYIRRRRHHQHDRRHYQRRASRKSP